MKSHLPMLAVLLAGCPEPVDEPTLDNGGAMSGGAMNGAAMNGAAMDGAPAGGSPGEMSSAPLDGPPSGAAGGGEMSLPTSMDVAAAPPTLGTFAGNLPDGELKPKYTQAELADGATVSGTLICSDCTGSLLVRALPPPPENPSLGSAPSSLQLITQASFSSAGAYSMKLPDGDPVVLQVVDDSNGDGFPSQGERMGMRAEGALLVQGEVSGVNLTVGVFPDQPMASGDSPPTPGEPPAVVAPGSPTPDAPDGAPPASSAPPADG